MNKRTFIRVVLHLGAMLPFAYIVWGVINQSIGADPQDVILHETGIWALRLLLLSLCMTPLQKLYRASKAVQYRRLFGLYAGFYMFLHLIVFCWFFVGWDLELFLIELQERVYILAGMLAIILMIPLIVTSTKGMQKRLGRRWKKLHKTVYLIAILAVIHFIWQSKSDLNEPLVYTLLLGALFGYRFWLKFKPKQALKYEI